MSRRSSPVWKRQRNAPSARPKQRASPSGVVAQIQSSHTSNPDGYLEGSTGLFQATLPELVSTAMRNDASPEKWWRPDESPPLRSRSPDKTGLA